VRREVSRWGMKRRILLHVGGFGVVGSVMQDGRETPAVFYSLLEPQYSGNIGPIYWMAVVTQQPHSAWSANCRPVAPALISS
jgi:hypothetical protein